MSRELLLRLLAEAGGSAVLAIEVSALGVEARDAAEAPSGGGIAVIGLQGPLTPRGLTFFGRQLTPGMNTFREQLGRAAADPDVGAIVLDVNSPGGTYAGTPETANAVRQANAAKPVIAVVDAMAGSAAYWIASQAGELVVTPSGEAGSIGVLAVHQEFSQALENEGVKVTIVRSRPSKADANPFEPLTARRGPRSTPLSPMRTSNFSRPWPRAATCPSPLSATWPTTRAQAACSALGPLSKPVWPTASPPWAKSSPA
jgi:ClpP class serine protease